MEFDFEGIWKMARLSLRIALLDFLIAAGGGGGGG